jgi:hypothetical protein
MPLSQESTRRVPPFVVSTSAYPITLCYSGQLLPNDRRRPPPSSGTQRPWRQLDIDEFRAALMDSFCVKRTSGLTTSINWPTNMTVH